MLVEDARMKCEMEKPIFSKGIWSHVCKMEEIFQKYAQRNKLRYSKELSDVTLMKKVSECQFHEKCVIVLNTYLQMALSS